MDGAAELFGLPLWWYPLLFATGLVAGFVDAVAGGGGLIAIPVLLSTGLPPQTALGTNKLQATFGSASAAWHYARAGLVDWRDCGTGVFFTVAGAVAGTLLVSHLPTDLLQQAIPWLLVVVILYLVFQPRVGAAGRQARMTSGWFHGLLGLSLGFYDGFFGPGTGTFWAMAYVVFRGFDLLRATAHTKVLNFSSNATSLAVFWASGMCHVPAGLCMGLGQLVGARLGSRIVIRRGVAFIRPLFIAVALAITVRLVWQNLAGT